MNNKIDLCGKKFDYFYVLREVNKTKAGKRVWECECFCGNIFNRQQDNILYRDSVGCGCKKSFKHGMSQSREYKTWEMMIQRCSNPKFDSYIHYGGRGITYDPRWENFINFYEDMGSRPENMSLDRIDVNGNYCKDNCRWADIKTQSYNKRQIQNSSGVTGVYWHKAAQKWTAQINFETKNIHLGIFDDINDAIKAREEAEMKYYGYLKHKGISEAIDVETTS